MRALLPVLCLSLVVLVGWLRPAPDEASSPKIVRTTAEQTLEVADAPAPPERGLGDVLVLALRTMIGAMADSDSGLEEFEAELRLHEPPHLREVARWVAETLETAYTAFDEHRYELCRKLCERILRLDPNYRIALELWQSAQRAPYGSFSPGAWEVLLDPWKRETESGPEPRIPRQETFRFPSRAEWLAFRWSGLEQLPLSPGNPAVAHWKLGSRRVDVNVEGMRLKDVVWILGSLGELDLLLDTESLVPSDLEAAVTFKVNDILVGGALKLLLQPRRMSYTVKEDGVVLVGRY